MNITMKKIETCMYASNVKSEELLSGLLTANCSWDKYNYYPPYLSHRNFGTFEVMCDNCKCWEARDVERKI